jgi:hypothetical protein
MGKHLEPKSPPPGSAPPVPPVEGNETTALLGPVSYGSYQQEDESTNNLRLHMQGQGRSPGYAPTISHYNENSVYASFGDINMRPNTGEDNWYDGEILGLALHEIMKSLQWSNILSCAAVIVLEVLVAIFRIFSPDRFVMGCYLAFFASLLLRVEVAQIIQQHRKQQQIMMESNGTVETNGHQAGASWIADAAASGLASSTRLPEVHAPFLRDNFGLLFHPSGKAFMLFLMASMCVGQNNNIFELVLGSVFAINALFTCYLMCQYPGYRRQEDIPVPMLPPSPGSTRGKVRQSATWSYYENQASSVWQVATTIAEGSSYLTSTGFGKDRAGSSFP